MTKHRSVVTGWDPDYVNPDTSTGRPKGVQTAIDMRIATTHDVLAEGIFAAYGTPSITGSPTDSASISPFMAAIESPLGGFYIVQLDDDENFTINMSNVGAVKIYVQQQDYEVNAAQVDSEVVIGVVYGATAIPDGALLLFTTTITSETSTSGLTFTPAFKWTGAASGAIRVPTTAGLPNVAVITTGMRALVTTGGGAGEYFWTGTVWQITTTASPAIDSLLTTGWIALSESWSFSSWDAATRIGVITVPTGATSRFGVGQRIKITQATGGTKIGIIHAVATTTLTVFFPSGTTLVNQAITGPFFSPVKAPLGFNTDPAVWSLESILTTDTTQYSPTYNTWYNLGSHSLAVGVGSWKLYAKNTHGLDRAAIGRTDHSHTISTSSSSESHARYTTGIANNDVKFTAVTTTVADDFTTASPVTLYALLKSSGGASSGVSNLFMFGSGSTTGGSRVIRVTSAHL